MTLADLRKGVRQFISRTGKTPTEARLHPQDANDLLKEAATWPGGELPRGCDTSIVSGVKCYSDADVAGNAPRFA